MTPCFSKWLGAFVLICTLVADPSAQAQTPPDEWLAKPITVEFDPGPFSEMLRYLEARYDLRIVLDKDAFAKIKVKDVEKKTVKLDRLEGVSAKLVMQKLLKQIPASYKVEKNQIRIVPTNEM